MTTARNDITGDLIQTKSVSNKYRTGWDAIFKNNKDVPQTETDVNEKESTED